MEIPLKITFRNMPPSVALENTIRDKAAKLESFYDRIMSCRITVEAPHRHHHKGKAYQVRIDMTVPGGELVIDRAPKRLMAKAIRGAQEPDTDFTERHDPSKHAAHEDAYVAIRDAFSAAARKLQEYTRRQSGAVKAHEPTNLTARVTRLFPEERYGFIETPDGREIYFHGNSVLQPGYERLDIGTEVNFAEELGAKGPQASTVRVIGR